MFHRSKWLFKTVSVLVDIIELPLDQHSLFLEVTHFLLGDLHRFCGYTKRFDRFGMLLGALINHVIVGVESLKAFVQAIEWLLQLVEAQSLLFEIVVELGVRQR